MADPKVMFILSHTLFKTSVTCGKKYRFEITNEGHKVLKNLVSGKYKKHGYILRHCIDSRHQHFCFYVPRILVINASGKGISHIILPDFVVPYIRHTLKTISIANSEYISTELNAFIESNVDLWDKTCDEEAELNSIQRGYLTRRYDRYIKPRLQLFLRLCYWVKGRTKSALFSIAECFSQFYYFDEKNMAISPVYYQEPPPL